MLMQQRKFRLSSLTQKSHWFTAHRSKIITMIVLIITAWILGQLAVPVIMKAMFL